MGREVRLVAPSWEHPRNDRGHYLPLYNGRDLASDQEAWDENEAKYLSGSGWAGETFANERSCGVPWSELDGPRPVQKDYMPIWDEGEATKLMLYETTSEGTPHWRNSLATPPKFDTLDELCEWAATNASTFGSFRASAGEWRQMLDRGFVHATDGNLMFC